MPSHERSRPHPKNPISANKAQSTLILLHAPAVDSALKFDFLRLLYS